MFNDQVTKAIADQGLGMFALVEEFEEYGEAEQAGPDGQRLLRESRIYRERGHLLDGQSAVAHSYSRRLRLHREAKVAHDLADQCLEDAQAIAHYGRGGMKWGVRRTKKQLGAADKAAGKSQKKLKKQVKKLSDEDLTKAVKRLQLEKSYKDLVTSSNKATQTRVQRGTAEMVKIAKASAKSAIQSHSTVIMRNAITTAIKKKYPTYEPPKK